MLRNSKGMVWIESLIAFHLMILLVSSLLPIYMTVKQEKEILYDRSVSELALFNEWQSFLSAKSFLDEMTKTRKLGERERTFSFIREGEYVKGCVIWENAKGMEEKRCLYGRP